MFANKALKIFSICVLVGVTVITGLWFLQKQDKKPVSEKPAEKTYAPSKPQLVIDYNELEKDEQLQSVTKDRKTKYGLEEGVDIIVRSDEFFKIGDTTVSMRESQDKMRLKSGDIIENDINSKKGASNKIINEFGIYVVQPGDNLWDIHFKLLKDYFNHKGISISQVADEPDRSGYSSGMGKLLKFSEHTVCIYNLKKAKLDVNINLISPLNKIIVYNMNEIFTLLDCIDYSKVNKVEFDGETLWIPAEQ